MEPVRRSQQVIAALFEHYIGALDLPGRWGGRVDAAPTEAGRARIICDFIAGMTDRYAAREHERLTGQRLLG